MRRIAQMKIASLLVLLVLAMGLAPLVAVAAEDDAPASADSALPASLSLADSSALASFSLNPFPNELYLRQSTSGVCTLASSAMMLRAQVYLRGNPDWPTITESSIRSSAWSSSGLLWSWSYDFADGSIDVRHKSVSGISASTLKALLDLHPEGIVLFAHTSDYSRSHAVFLTDYVGDTFYCADPAPTYDGVRRTLESSNLGAYFGDQASILTYVMGYWYVSSCSISGEHVHSFTSSSEATDDVYHRSSCACGERQQEPHAFVWSGVRYVCAKCGAEGSPVSDGEHVTTQATNLYDGDSPYASVAAVIPANTVIAVSDARVYDSRNFAMGKVSYGGCTGYVHLTDVMPNGNAGIHEDAAAVPAMAWYYRTVSSTTAYYANLYSSQRKTLAVGTRVSVSSVSVSSEGDYWGKTSEGYWVAMSALEAANTWVNDSRGWWYAYGEDMHVETGKWWPANEWVCIDDVWYRFDEDGYMQTGWIRADQDINAKETPGADGLGAWYLLSDSGELLKGKWREDSSGWCYLDPETGEMWHDRWAFDSYGPCYVGAYGPCVTGWFRAQVNCDGASTPGADGAGAWYHSTSDGQLDRGKWIADSHGWCYVDAKTGELQRDTWAFDSYGPCRLNGDGYCEIGWFRAQVNCDGASTPGADGAGAWYCANAQGQLLRGVWAKDSVGWCYVDAKTGELWRSAWKSDSSGWCYVDDDGYCVVGVAQIDSGNGEAGNPGAGVYDFGTSGSWVYSPTPDSSEALSESADVA